MKSPQTTAKNDCGATAFNSSFVGDHLEVVLGWPKGSSRAIPILVSQLRMAYCRGGRRENGGFEISRERAAK